MSKSAAQLHDAEILLHLVESALKQVIQDHVERRVPGVRNMLVFGGYYTTMMEAIASANPLFASWFDLHQPPEGIETLRREMLRPAKTRRDFTQVQLASSAGAQFGPRPKNARAFFTADRLGGAGFEVELPGGGVEKYYVSLPDELPAGYSFGGVGIDAEPLMRRYAAHFREVMRYAKIAVR